MAKDLGPRRNAIHRILPAFRACAPEPVWTPHAASEALPRDCVEPARTPRCRRRALSNWPGCPLSFRPLFSDIVHWKAYDLGCETPKKTEKVFRKISVRLP